MQLYASDFSGRVAAAATATRGADYQCLECQGTVRLRSGPHRQPHFFHLSAPSHCRQHGKSLAHLEAQRFLERLLRSDSCLLERRFPEIDRIADVVWLPHNIIFEVQCSPITAEEVAERNRDYEAIGYQVVWLLHEQQFNRRRVSAAEATLRHRPYYFTDIDAEGMGGIYDQYDVITDGLRRHRLDPLSVDLSQPRRVREGNSLYFAGDLVDIMLNHPHHDYLLKMEGLEVEHHAPKPALWRRLWQRGVVHPYVSVLQALLEKVSR